MLIIGKAMITKMKNLMQNAAIRGFSIFAKKQVFAEHYNGKINYSLINKFLNQYGDSKFLVFGLQLMFIIFL